MADEILTPDVNAHAVSGGVTNDASLEIVQLRLDPTTKRLLVDAAIDVTGVTDAEAVDAGDLGLLVLGTDSANYQILRTDADGHLQVDILSGGSSGTQYTEDDAAAANPIGTAVALVRADTPAGVATTDGDILVQRGTDYGAAYVQVLNSSGSFVDTFGGGTQYTEGDTDASITGTALIVEGAANALIAVSGLDLTNANPLTVAIVDSDGTQITSFGGGTQYTEDATDASITGTVAMMEVAGDAIEPIQGTVADGLLVNLGANNDITGTVTANAGTNLNTSLLALEAGGNLAAVATSLGNLDNSVDGNYLNVNLNAAGTDVATNAGVLTAQTLRVTIATDDEVNNLLGTIDADTSTLSALSKAEDAAHSTGDTGLMLLAVRDDDTPSATSGTAGDYEALHTDANGNLWVTLGTKLSSSEDSIVAVGDVAHDSADAGNPIKIGGKALSAAPSAVTANDRVNAFFDTSGMQHNVVGASAIGVGLDTIFDADGDNTAQQCKASAGRLYGIEVSNPNSTDAYLQLFDVATAGVTVGTTTPKLSFFIPAGDGTNDGAMDKFFSVPITFATAITYACTTTATGSGDPTTGLIVNLLYK